MDVTFYAALLGFPTFDHQLRGRAKLCCNSQVPAAESASNEAPSAEAAAPEVPAVGSAPTPISAPKRAKKKAA